MNKLLLLATTLFCLNLQGYSSGVPEQGGAASNQSQTVQDSSIKGSNPKDAFKELFESETDNGIQITRLNPKAVSFVQDYIESDGTRLTQMKSKSKPFFDRIDQIFTRYDLPVELKYLAVIESDLKTSATSRVGAAGPWQFMAETAKGLGLRVSRKVDERRDFNKSTVAAAKYLSNLYDVYKDWLLVIAAYNSGPGKVNSAISRSGSRNFWDLQYHLPAETRNHVKKFIATHYIMEGDGGVTTLTKKETENLSLLTSQPVVNVNTITLNVSGKYHSLAITQNIQMDIVEFSKLNPNFDKQLSVNGSYELRLPNEKMQLFQANKPQILEQSVRLMLSTVSS